MARARGARSTHALAFESTYGTAPASGYRTVPVISNGLGRSRDLLEDEVLGNRDAGDHEYDAPNVDGDLQIPVDCTAFGNWLKAALGAPSTTNNSGTYTHVYSSGGWSIPSFALEKGLPDVPAYHMVSGAKLDRLQFTLQRGGRLQATAGIIAKDQANAGTTAAGTPTSYDRNRFVQSQGALTMDGSALAEIVSMQVNYANNLERDEVITGDGTIGGLDELVATLGLTVVARFATTTLLDKAIAGTPVAISMSLTRSASEKLTIDAPRVFLPEPKITVEGPQGIQATFNAMASRDTDGSSMMVATLINAVASY